MPSFEDTSTNRSSTTGFHLSSSSTLVFSWSSLIDNNLLFELRRRHRPVLPPCRSDPRRSGHPGKRCPECSRRLRLGRVPFRAFGTGRPVAGTPQIGRTAPLCSLEFSVALAYLRVMSTSGRSRLKGAGITTFQLAAHLYPHTRGLCEEQVTSALSSLRPNWSMPGPSGD